MAFSSSENTARFASRVDSVLRFLLCRGGDERREGRNGQRLSGGATRETRVGRGGAERGASGGRTSRKRLVLLFASAIGAAEARPAPRATRVERRGRDGRHERATRKRTGWSSAMVAVGLSSSCVPPDAAMSGEAAASARPVTAALGFADSMRTSISGNFETEDAYANSEVRHIKAD